MSLSPLLRPPVAFLVGPAPGDPSLHAGDLRRASPTRRRAIAASVVCAGHVLLLLAVWQLKQALPDDVTEKRRSTSIRLLPERVARPQAAAAPAAARAMAMPRLPAPPLEPADASSLLIPIPAIAGSAEATGQGSGIATAAAPGTAASGAAPRLELKPQREVLLGSLTSLAANDPRANTPKPTFEERIAMGADPEACVKVERMPDGSVRRSMGRLQEALSTMQATYGVGGRSIKTCR